MRLEGKDRKVHCKNKLSLWGNSPKIRTHQWPSSSCSTFTLWYISIWFTTWLSVDTMQIHARYKQSWLLRYNADPWGRLKFGHSYQTYNIYLYHTDANMSTTMNIQMWIHAMNHINTPSQPGEINECLTDTKIFVSSSTKYNYINVITCIDVEHGRNHLIIGQWWKLLIIAREITIDVNDSQGTLVRSTECE